MLPLILAAASIGSSLWGANKQAQAVKDANTGQNRLNTDVAGNYEQYSPKVLHSLWQRATGDAPWLQGAMRDAEADTMKLAGQQQNALLRGYQSRGLLNSNIATGGALGANNALWGNFLRNRTALLRQQYDDQGNALSQIGGMVGQHVPTAINSYANQGAAASNAMNQNLAGIGQTANMLALWNQMNRYGGGGSTPFSGFGPTYG